MSFATKFTSAAGAAALLATTALAGADALAQEQQMPPPNRQQIAYACKQLTSAVNQIPGITILFSGHPALKNYKPANLRHAAEQMCPSLKKVWTQKGGPAHQWRRADTGAPLRTERDIAPALVSAVQQFHDIIHGDPAINALVHGTKEAHQDFHFAMAEAQRLIAQYPDIFKPQQQPPQQERPAPAPAPRQQAPEQKAPEMTPAPAPERKAPDTKPAPEQKKKTSMEEACDFFVQGLDKHPGITVLLHGHALFPDYDAKPLGDAVRAACKIDDAAWNKAPAHDWTGPRTGKFDTVEKLIPAVGDAAMKIHYLARTTPEFKKIVQDNAPAWTALEKFMGQLRDRATGKAPAAPAPQQQPAPSVH